MKGKRRAACFAAAMTAALLFGCGSGSDLSMEETATGTMAAYNMTDGGQLAVKSASAVGDGYEAAEMSVMEENGTLEAESGETLDETATDRKLIREVSLEVETKEFDTLTDNITARVEALGGYVESFSTSRYSIYDTRTGSIIARVPTDRLDSFLDEVAEQSNVLSRNESVRDVTLQYVDLDTHKKSLVTERDRLLELLEQAENVADIVEIESSLSEVRYQIESLETQLRTIDNQVDYSTVYIDIREVELLTPAADKSAWDEIAEGFAENVHRVFERVREAAIGLVISLPFILAWLVAAAAVVLFVVLCMKVRRKIRKRRQERKRVGKIQETDYEIIEEAPAEESPAEKNR